MSCKKPLRVTRRGFYVLHVGFPCSEQFSLARIITYRISLRYCDWIMEKTEIIGT
jgi:hypothetical protein